MTVYCIFMEIPCTAKGINDLIKRNSLIIAVQADQQDARNFNGAKNKRETLFWIMRNMQVNKEWNATASSLAAECSLELRFYTTMHWFLIVRKFSGSWSIFGFIRNLLNLFLMANLSLRPVFDHSGGKEIDQCHL